MPTARRRATRSTGSATRWSSTCPASAAPARWRHAAGRHHLAGARRGACAARQRRAGGSAGRGTQRARRDPRRHAAASTWSSLPACIARPPGLSTFPGVPCRSSRKCRVGAGAGFVSPTQAPASRPRACQRGTGSPERQRDHRAVRSRASALAATRLLMSVAGELDQARFASRFTAVNEPPHTQPVSSASRSARRLKPSVDQ